MLPGGWLFSGFHVASGLFTHWMLGAGQPTAGLNHFFLSVRLVSRPDSGRLSSPYRLLVLQGRTGGGLCSFASLLAHCHLVSFPYNAAQADNYTSCSLASSFTRRGWEEWCCLHRPAWQGNAMHLKAGGEEEEEEEEERGLREGGGGEEREWRRRRRRRRMRW